MRVSKNRRLSRVVLAAAIRVRSRAPLRMRRPLTCIPSLPIPPTAALSEAPRSTTTGRWPSGPGAARPSDRPATPSILRGDGGVVTPLYWDFSSGTQHVPRTDVLSINDDGVVAFAVGGPCQNAGAAAIWTAGGGSTSVVHDICRSSPGSRRSSGRQSATAARSPSWRRPGTATTTSCGRKTAPWSRSPVRARRAAGIGPLSGAHTPTMNNHDVVSFTGNRADTGRASSSRVRAGRSPALRSTI